MKFLLVTLVVFFLSVPSYAWKFNAPDSVPIKVGFFQNSPDFNKRRFHFLEGSYAVVYAGSMTWLYTLWYQKYPQEKFHFFNDFPEWQQMDKMGHATTAFYTGKFGTEVFEWSGMPRKKAVWYGASTGFIFLFTVEVFDGFSKNWGFSPTDLTANTLGSSLLVSQMLAWNETRLQLKFSFHQESTYSHLRPDELGRSFNENLLKDYNGQTYWLSGNIYSFLNKSSRFPRWLNIAAGYGAEGMVGGMNNIVVKNNVVTADYSYIPRQRKFFLSLDADLSKLKMKPGLLNTLIHSIGFLKIPAPAFEWKQNGKMKFYPIYF